MPLSETTGCVLLHQDKQDAAEQSHNIPLNTYTVGKTLSELERLILF